MAKTDRFLIAPYASGIQTNMKPWIIPDDAFQVLDNAYIYRGRVRKRFGSYLLNSLVPNGEAPLYSRLRVKIGTTDGSGNFSGFTPGAGTPLVTPAIGQIFSVTSNVTGHLDEMYTVYQTGTPAATLTTSSTGTATYNTTTGAFVLTGSQFLTSSVYFYPALPVIGFVIFLNDEIDTEPTFAFDTVFAYYWNTTEQAWERLSAGGSAAVWTGPDYQLMWGSMYRGLTGAEYYMFVVNNNPADGIRYWSGMLPPAIGGQWNQLTTTIDAAGDYVATALMVVPFQNRLILLNTTENISSTNLTFVNRARFSQFGDPTSANAWLQDTPGLGGFVDAPVKQAIISSEFIKDRLIVYFENSTWELAYTGNQVKPFRWQQINTELGSESTFSIVPFDKIALALDEVGIHACNGANVERIDWKIPQYIWEMTITGHGPLRAYGIRDYFTELVYWSYPVDNRYNVYPNKVLIYNYQTQSFGTAEDNITAFGYFNQQVAATWNQITKTWEEITETWTSSRFNPNSQQVIAGNQEGFTFIVDEDTTRNAPALQITNISLSGNMILLTVINHNLSGGEFVIVENVQGLTGINGNIYQNQIISGSSGINTIVLFGTAGISGTYIGGGTVALVSNINILTKQYNFYVNEGVNSTINKVDFQVTNTADGEVTVDYYLSSSTESALTQAMATGTITGTGTLETSPYDLYPLEQEQERLWHPIYPFAQGEFIQLQIYMTDDQIMTPEIAFSDFQLHAMCFYTSPTGRLE